MQAIKLVTFDATNTFLKFKIPPWQYYSIVARDYGFTGTEEKLKTQMMDSYKIMEKKHPNFGKSDITWKNWWKELIKLTFQDQLPAYVNIDTMATLLINDYNTTKCWSVADGSETLLNFLRQNGVCVGVISNFDPRLNVILCNISLHKCFDFVLTSYEAGYSKPDRRIFNSALKASKILVKPSEALHIGDDLEKDYNGARAAGWHALLVGSSFANKAPPVTKHVFSSLQELSLALEQNNIIL